jgi:Coenzyme PQQ synthesis protein D (PqqD)
MRSDAFGRARSAGPELILAALVTRGLETQETRMKIDEKAVLERAGDVVEADTEDGHTLLHGVETGHYFALSPTGAAIWRLIAEPRSIGDIVSALRSQYDVPAVECRQDVLEFVESLLERQLLRVRA